MPAFFEYGFYISVFLVCLFLYKKKKPLPTKLDLSSFKGATKDFKGKASLGAIRKVVAEVVDDEKPKASKDVFLFKSKKYNAWQVLSLPLGAGSKEISAAYASKVQGDSKNKDLYFKAYKVLKD